MLQREFRLGLGCSARVGVIRCNQATLASSTERHFMKARHEEKTVRRPGDANRDPITGTPGAHPVGTGIGAAAGGAAAGAAVGSVAGPVGTAAGMVAGAVVGGLAGKGVAEAIDPTVEDAYWRENYRTRSYVEPGTSYESYQPAYRTGYEGYSRYRGRRFDDVEMDLRRDYERTAGKSGLAWDKARHATRDAWHRVEEALPGDADRDGR
jgi:outer membrane lipoprotein SlyB